jgi:hypothetical protein
MTSVRSVANADPYIDPRDAALNRELALSSKSRFWVPERAGLRYRELLSELLRIRKS